MFSEGTAPLVTDSAEKSLKKINALLERGNPSKGAIEVDWDINGNPEEIRYFDQVGRLVLTESFTYDLNGNPTRIEGY
jgi:hypothetical protein